MPADAAIVAVADSKRCDAIATFDQKLQQARERPRRGHVPVTSNEAK